MIYSGFLPVILEQLRYPTGLGRIRCLKLSKDGLQVQHRGSIYSVKSLDSEFRPCRPIIFADVSPMGLG